MKSYRETIKQLMENEIHKLVNKDIICEFNVFGFIKKYVKNISSFLSKAFKNLPFGKSKTVKFNLSDHLEESRNIVEGGGTAYHYGAYVEILTAKKIHDKLLEYFNSGEIGINTNVDEKMLATSMKVVKKEDDLKRAEISSTMIADEIFKNLIKLEDILFIKKITILRTGLPTIRADLTINLQKDDIGNVIEKLEYSLKSMAGKNFTVYSSTGGAFLKLFVDFKGKKRKEWLEMVEKKIDDFDILEKKLKDSAQYKKNNDEESLSKNRIEISKIVSKIINQYGSSEPFVSNFLEVCGLDFENVEKIYVAVGEHKNINLVNSETSQNFKKLLEQISKGVYITSEHKGDEKGFIIKIMGLKDNLEIPIPIRGGWGVTSSKSGTPKLNILGTSEIF